MGPTGIWKICAGGAKGLSRRRRRSWKLPGAAADPAADAKGKLERPVPPGGQRARPGRLQIRPGGSMRKSGRRGGAAIRKTRLERAFLDARRGSGPGLARDVRALPVSTPPAPSCVRAPLPEVKQAKQDYECRPGRTEQRPATGPAPRGRRPQPLQGHCPGPPPPVWQLRGVTSEGRRRGCSWKAAGCPGRGDYPPDHCRRKAGGPEIRPRPADPQKAEEKRRMNASAPCPPPIAGTGRRPLRLHRRAGQSDPGHGEKLAYPDKKVRTAHKDALQEP